MKSQIIPVLILILNSNVFGQTFCLENILFENNEFCTITSVKAFDHLTDDFGTELKNFFEYDKIINSESKGECKKIAQNNAGVEYHLGNKIVELKYSQKTADQIFEKLIKHLNSPIKSIDLMFRYFKPGKIISLDSNNSCITITYFNSCRDMDSFQKLVDCVSNDVSLNTIAIKCGDFENYELFNQ